jgi:protein O-GlcNAc transferase
VAYEGTMMRARQTSAMLRIMGIPELITDSDDAYVATVVALANDPQRLRDIRTRILAGRDALFNDVSTVRALEETLAQLITTQ